MTDVFLRLSGQARKRPAKERALETMTAQSQECKDLRMERALQRGEVLSGMV